MRRAYWIGSVALLAAQLGTAQADDWRFYPAGDEGFVWDPTVSVVGGQLDPDVRGADAATVTGIELALNCPTLAAPGGVIRQQLSVTRFDEDDLELTSIELNPHYTVPVDEALALGFGPGIGYVRADNGSEDDGVFGFQLGGSVHYRSGALYLGAEVRWQWTQEADFGATDSDVDNSRVVAKVGYNF